MYVHMFVNHRVTLPKNKRTETDTFQKDFCFLCFVSPCEIQKNITIQTHFVLSSVYHSEEAGNTKNILSTLENFYELNFVVQTVQLIW